MREAGKGDTYRPTDQKAFNEGYDRIFGNKYKEREDDQRIHDPEKLTDGTRAGEAGAGKQENHQSGQ